MILNGLAAGLRDVSQGAGQSREGTTCDAGQDGRDQHNQGCHAMVYGTALILTPQRPIKSMACRRPASK